MPIRFRCDSCNRLLGIARRKAGAETTCPHCGHTITVPQPPATDPGLTDVEKLLQRAGVATVSRPERLALPTKPALPAPPVAPDGSGERPLFEKNLDEVLGATGPAETREPVEPPRPAVPAGTDATSLRTEGGRIVLSSRQATAVAVAIVVLLALSFVAGFVVASR